MRTVSEYSTEYTQDKQGTHNGIATDHIEIQYNNYPDGESEVNHDNDQQEEKEEVETPLPPPVDTYSGC